MTANNKSKSFHIESLEKDIANYVGTKHAVLCSSARTALRLCLLSLGLKKEDEVIIPDFACQILPTTAFCAGALPRFCDVNRTDFSLSPEYFSKALRPKTKAVVFIHMFGCAVDPFPILEITRKKEIYFIDDAAQALGAKVNGKKTGSFGDAGLLTFNKFLDVDFGGAITTNNQEIAVKAKLLREKYQHRSYAAVIGYRMTRSLGLKPRKAMKIVFRGNNHLYKLVNVTLAKKHFREIDGFMTPSKEVLESWYSNALTPKMIDQLMTYATRYWHSREMEKLELTLLKDEFKNVDKRLQNRQKLAKIYDERLAEGAFFKPNLSANAVPAYLRYSMLVPDRKKLLNCITELRKEGFAIDYRYKPLHNSPFFYLTNNEHSNSFEHSTYVSEHVLPLPIDRNMSYQTIEKVASIVNANLHH